MQQKERGWWCKLFRREQAPLLLEKQHSDLDRAINFLARESGLQGVTQGHLGA